MSFMQFQKKSKQRIATPKHEIDLIEDRFKRVKECISEGSSGDCKVYSQHVDYEVSSGNASRASGCPMRTNATQGESAAKIG